MAKKVGLFKTKRPGPKAGNKTDFFGGQSTAKPVRGSGNPRIPDPTLTKRSRGRK